MKYILLLLLLTSSIACTSDIEEIINEKNNVNEVLSYLRYIQDDFGICYALLLPRAVGYGYSAVTTVDCSKVKLSHKGTNYAK